MLPSLSPIGVTPNSLYLSATYAIACLYSEVPGSLPLRLSSASTAMWCLISSGFTDSENSASFTSLSMLSFLQLAKNRMLTHKIRWIFFLNKFMVGLLKLEVVKIRIL